MEKTPSTEISSSRIDKLFSWLLSRYGDRFTRQFDMVAPATLKHTWELETANLTDLELRKGLETCRTSEWPPTLPQFLNMCRPPVDYEKAFNEAAQSWPKRDGWSSPAVWWAATSIGNDVRTMPYKAIAARWHMALDRFLENPLPIPAEPERKLSEPTVEQVHERLNNFNAEFQQKPPNRDWAYAHIESYEKHGYSKGASPATVAIAREAVRTDLLPSPA